MMTDDILKEFVGKEVCIGTGISVFKGILLENGPGMYQITVVSPDHQIAYMFVWAGMLERRQEYAAPIFKVKDDYFTNRAKYVGMINTKGDC